MQSHHIRHAKAPHKVRWSPTLCVKRTQLGGYPAPPIGKSSGAFYAATTHVCTAHVRAAVTAHAFTAHVLTAHVFTAHVCAAAHVRAAVVVEG